MPSRKTGCRPRSVPKVCLPVVLRTSEIWVGVCTRTDPFAHRASGRFFRVHPWLKSRRDDSILSPTSGFERLLPDFDGLLRVGLIGDLKPVVLERECGIETRSERGGRLEISTSPGGILSRPPAGKADRLDLSLATGGEIRYKKVVMCCSQNLLFQNDR